jgi:hypothetical protein
MPEESCLVSTGEEHTAGVEGSSLTDAAFSTTGVGRFSSTTGMLFSGLQFASSSPASVLTSFAGETTNLQPNVLTLIVTF